MSPKRLNAEEGRKGARRSDRYAGLRPFVKEDRSIFFGRQKEIEQLYNGIQVCPVFILYGKSGLGKSSLVNAGLLPKLEKLGYKLAVIRFYIEKDLQKNHATATEIIIGELGRCLGDTSMDGSGEDEALKRVANLKDSHPVLLVFDQFEEFQYYPLAERVAACRFLNLLLQATPSVTIKVLFLIRSDRFYLMKDVSDYIPGILSSTLELAPLTADKAEEAIELPGQIASLGKPGAGFKTAPFEYTISALRTILETLQNAKGEIESSQLQIVCQELEEIASTTRLIDAANFGGAEGIREILNKFYDKQIAKLEKDPDLRLSKKDLRIIHELIEDELVSAGKRVIQSETRVRDILSTVRPDMQVIKEVDKVDLLIDKLLGLRLIREDDSHLGKVYEISHDTLLPAIIESRGEYLRKRKLLKYAKFAGAALFLITAAVVFASVENGRSHNEELRHQHDEFSHQADSLRYRTAIKYTLSLDLKRDSIVKIVKKIDSLNSSLKSQVNQYRLDNESSLNIINGKQIQLYNLKYKLIDLEQTIIRQKIRIDSQKQVITALQKNEIPDTKPKAPADLKTQLTAESRQLAAAKQMVYKPSWFKPGNFLQFENIKVLLDDLDRQHKKIRFRLFEMGSATGGGEKQIQNKDFTLDVTKSLDFDYNGISYNILFQKIAAGGSIFSTAAYIVFTKKPGAASP